MASSACDDLADVAVRLSHGESVPAEEQAEWRRHLATCESCRGQAAIYGLMRADASEADEYFGADGINQVRNVNAALNGLAAEERRLLSPKSWWLLGGLGFAGAAAAALVLVVLPQWRPIDSPPPVQAAVLSGTGNAIRVTERTFGEGADVQTGTEGLHLQVGDEGVRIALAPETRLSLTRLAPDSLELTLVYGKIIGHKSSPADSQLTVTFGSQQLLVTGTLFEVVQPEGGKAVAVRVLHGRVRVTHRDSASLEVRGGQQSIRGDITELSAEDQTRLSAIEAALTGKETVALVEPEPEMEPDPEPTGVKPKGGPSAAKLLRKAQKLRRARKWQLVAETYREIIERHGPGAEGGLAQVKLGKVLVENLAEPKGGLEACRAYLRRNADGALAEEAWICQIAALQQLGRKAREKKTIEAFIKRFPLSVEVSALRKRLESL